VGPRGPKVGPSVFGRKPNSCTPHGDSLRKGLKVGPKVGPKGSEGGSEGSEGGSESLLKSNSKSGEQRKGTTHKRKRKKTETKKQRRKSSRACIQNTQMYSKLMYRSGGHSTNDGYDLRKEHERS
jgi:hypothetical protein